MRVELSTRADVAVNSTVDGVMAIVQHPNQWPNSGVFIPTGSTAAVVIKPTVSYTTDDVRQLAPAVRQCLNVSESAS